VCPDAVGPLSANDRLEVPSGELPVQFVVDGPLAPLDCSPGIVTPSALAEVHTWNQLSSAA
jgi:hypothetical protein